jgi:hypothetical protein
MKRVCVALLALLVAPAIAAPADLKLADEQVLIKLSGQHPPGAWDMEHFNLNCMQLSPDGSRLLYIQRMFAPAKPEEKAGARLVLRDLITQKETVLPIPQVTGSAGVLNHLMAGRLFDPAGKRIVLGIGIPAEGKEVTNSPGETDRMQAAMYDIASGKLQKLTVEGPAVLPMFDATGKTVLALSYDIKTNVGTLFRAAADKLEFKAVQTLGLPRAACPGTDLVAMLVKREKPQESEYKLVLYDPAADRIVQEPTATGPNWNLVLTPPLWTADGRYLCYQCSEKVDDKYRWFTRIWDRTAGKVVADLDQVYLVGPGPTPTTLVMGKITAGNKRGAVLYDAAAGTTTPLGDKEMELMAAGGGKVFYVKRVGDDDAFCSARIVLPSGPQP